MIEDADASAGDRFGHGIVVVFILEVDVGDGRERVEERSIGHAIAGDGEFIVSFGRGWSGGGGRGQWAGERIQKWRAALYPGFNNGPNY